MGQEHWREYGIFHAAQEHEPKASPANLRYRGMKTFGFQRHRVAAAKELLAAPSRA
jgi:hypothetical protein